MNTLIGISSILCVGVAFLSALGAVGYFVYVYNRIVSLENAIDNSFNQIRVALKKRLDKISQLVDATGSMAKFEKETMTQIAKFRSAKMDSAKDVSSVARASGALVGQIMAVMESYPELKTNQSVSKLMNEIDEVEDEIARLRYLYNDQVQTFNNLVEKFPSVIVAKILGKGEKEYLKFGEEVEKRPSTKF